MLNEKVDTIVLSGIVGENSIIIRKLIIEKLHETFNVELNEKENKEISFDSKIKNGVITTNNSQIPIFVIQNKEELMILEELNNKLKNTKKLIYKQKY